MSIAKKATLIYTERDSTIGFGLEVNIRNMDRLTIVDSRGFGQAENPIFELRSVQQLKARCYGIYIY